MESQTKPAIELIDNDGEVTLSIGGEQAMQAWERELMWASADMLCEYGRDFYEVGLGLGLSALRIAENPATRSHAVLELFDEVEELFRDRHPHLPGNLTVERGDFFQRVFALPRRASTACSLIPPSTWRCGRTRRCGPGPCRRSSGRCGPAGCSSRSSAPGPNSGGNTCGTSAPSGSSATATRPTTPPSTRTAPAATPTSSASGRTDVPMTTELAHALDVGSLFLAGPFLQLLDPATGEMPEEARAPFSLLIKHFEGHGLDVHNAHRREAWGAELMPPDTCTRLDQDGIRDADVFVALPGAPPSPGTHIEIGWASAFDKPIVLLLERGREYTFLVRGWTPWPPWNR
ncbi:hypothetical protein ACFQ2B_32895 [Streptomyces stramineus]